MIRCNALDGAATNWTSLSDDKKTEEEEEDEEAHGRREGGY